MIPTWSLLLVLAACQGGTLKLEEGAAAADSGIGTDGGTDPGEDSGGALELGACEAPDPLPVDPLVQSGFLSVPDAGGPLLTHMVDVEADLETKRAYAVGYQGFFAFDISEADPQLLGGYGNPNELFRLEILDGDAVAVSHREYGWRIMDVSDPTRPEPLGQESLNGASGMAHSGELLYVVTHLGELVTYDLSDRDRPGEIHRVSGLENAWEIALAGERAYVADNALGVVVVDLSDPRAPAIGAAVETAAGLQDLAIGDGALYAAIGSGGMEVFSLADPDLPVSAGRLEYGSSVVSVDEAGGVLWATNNESVIAIDVSDPLAPVPLATQPTAEWALHVFALGDTALVADWANLVRFEVDTALRSPDAELSRETVYFTTGSTTTTLALANRGGGDLSLLGWALEDPRFASSVDRTTIPPGESAEITLTFTDDGAEVDATLCLATDDPETPLQQVALTSTSSGGSTIAMGEQAIDFVLPDVDGDYHQLSENFGQPVLLVFFATW